MNRRRVVAAVTLSRIAGDYYRYLCASARDRSARDRSGRDRSGRAPELTETDPVHGTADRPRSRYFCCGAFAPDCQVIDELTGSLRVFLRWKQDAPVLQPKVGCIASLRCDLDRPLSVLPGGARTTNTASYKSSPLAVPDRAFVTTEDGWGCSATAPSKLISQYARGH